MLFFAGTCVYCAEVILRLLFVDFQAIENNQFAAIHVQDPTVLPELCEIHKHQMPQMLRNHDQLQEIKNKCRCAKVDLSENLHKRLRSGPPLPSFPHSRNISRFLPIFSGLFVKWFLLFL